MYIYEFIIKSNLGERFCAFKNGIDDDAVVEFYPILILGDSKFGCTLNDDEKHGAIIDAISPACGRYRSSEK